ncbi:transmembrane protein, putative (macronuclear) [Tetrahymena thermophila SB210]|uniref:Transmembrane protein, putative n=1 Tax=Tetrahymena thermophila (strain SB210) TaxID=312017 RepID=I7LTA7_TETTS|nr:transmembrane protein, putative [Tetrahymena thermophila SB210]EAR84904.2 transmembrane protein, putative [Tetrahymena thermophila SB210]|eukprot:XP_001032567.2 transmembrane protein, putative [Tetrahymena thermophila SB210]
MSITPSLIKSGFSKVDIFGSQVQLSFNKHSKYQSAIGGILSIFLAVGLAVFFWTNQVQISNLKQTKKIWIYEILKIAEVKVVNQRTFDADPSNIYLTNRNFMFAIRFNQDNFLQNPYFNISLSQGMMLTDENVQKLQSIIGNWSHAQKNISSIYLLMEQIGLKYLNRMLQKTFFAQHKIQQSNQQLSTYKYLQIYKQIIILYLYKNAILTYAYLNRSDETFQIGGDYTASSFYYLQFSVSDCSNSTGPDQLWRPVCKSKQDIQQYLQNNIYSTINLYFPTVMVNPDEPNDDESIITYLNTDTFFYLQPTKMYKTADIFFTDYEITTDDSLLPTKQISTKHFPLYETKDFREQALLGTNGNYADFFIRRSYFSVKINRSFTKFDEIIAYIGGFVEAFLIFLSIFVHSYNECLFTVALANKLYDFDIDPQNNSYFGPTHSQTPRSKRSRSSFQNQNDQFQNSNQKNQFGRQSISQNQPQTQNIPLKSIQFFGAPQKKKSNLHIQINDQNEQFENQALEDLNNHELNNSKNMEIDNLDDSDVIYRKKLYNACIRKMNQRQISQSSLYNLKKKKKNQRSKSTIIQQKSTHQDNTSESFSIQNDDNILQDEIKQDKSSKSYIPDKLKHIQLKKRIRRANPSISKKNSNLNQLTFNSLNSIQKSEISHQSYERNNTLVPSIFSPLSSTQNQNFTSEKKLFTSSKFSLFSPSQMGLLNLKSTQSNPDANSEYNKIGQKEAVGIQDIKLNIKPESQSQKKYFKAVKPQNVQILEQNSNKESKNLEDFDKKKQALSRVLNLKRSFKKLQYLKGEFKSLLSKSQSQIKVTISYFLFKLSCKQYFRSKNNLLIEKSKELLEEELDVYVILEKLKEVNKLKELFLDKEQQILFNFFPKPFLKVDQVEEFQLSKDNLIGLHANTPKDNRLNIYDESKRAGVLSPNNPKNLKTIGIFAQAISKMKKGIKPKSHVPSSIDAYKRLYECYVVCNQDKNKINEKLINMLGNEVNQIFQKSQQIQDDYDRSVQNSAKSSQNKQHFTFKEVQIEQNGLKEEEPENMQKKSCELNDNIIEQENFQKRDENQNYQFITVSQSDEVNQNPIHNNQESNKQNSSSEKEKDDSNIKNEVLNSRQSNYHNLFLKSGFLRNKIEQIDNNQNILGSSLFVSTNRNSEIIINSALRKKDLTNRDSKKKLQFKQSSSIKDYSDAEDKDNQNNLNDENGEQYQQIITLKTDYCDEDEEEGNIFKPANSRCEIIDTQQDIVNTENDNCLAPRNKSFSNIQNQNSKFQFSQDHNLQLNYNNFNQQNTRKTSIGLMLSHQNSSPFANLLGSNRSISEIDPQPNLNLDEQYSKPSEKIIEPSQAIKKSKNTYSIFNKSSRINFQQQSNYYLEKLKQGDDNQDKIDHQINSSQNNNNNNSNHQS